MGITTLVGWIFSLLTIGAGIWQYADKKAQSNKEPFLRKQLDLCFAASDAAAALATTADAEKWQSAREEFWRLYWGTLSIVEDTNVEIAMVKFGNRLEELPRTPELPANVLQEPSLALAHAARDLILESWKVDLPKLKGRTI